MNIKNRFLIYLFLLFLPSTMPLHGCKTQENPGIENRGYLWLGLVAPLSGPLSSMGEYLLSGAQMAVDEANTRGGVRGRPVKLLIEDENDAKIPASSRLARDPRVLIIIGHLLERKFESARLMYQKAELPVLLPALSDENASMSDQNLFFRLSASNKDQARALARYSRKELELTRVYIIMEDSDQGRLLASAFQEAFKKTVTSLTMPDTPEGLETLISSLKSSKPEAVFLALPGVQAVCVSKALHDKNIQTILLGTDSLVFADTLNFINKFASRILLSLPYKLTGQTGAMKDFNEIYQSRYHQPPNRLAITGYDSVGLALKAIAQAGDSPRAIKDYLNSLNSAQNAFTGVAGDYFFNEKGRGGGPIFVVRLNEELLNSAP